jgi:hypothetical protein
MDPEALALGAGQYDAHPAASWLRPRLRVRVLRALAVAGIWAVALLPAALGWQRCTFATLVHRPCPGCGMTRAMHLLLAGHVESSLRMHPFALPVLGVWLLFMASTVYATWTADTPLAFYKGRFGRSALAAMVVVYAATLALWILRWFGLFGGPVPVY